MRERAQKPFGLGGDIGLHVSRAGTSNVAPTASDAGWRTSVRDRPRSEQPRIGQILLALIVVAAMAAGLHFFFY